MNRLPTRTYTVRHVPAGVDAALRKRAVELNCSLNQVVLEILKQSAAPMKKIDLSDLVGKWEDDPAFDEIIASQRKIDWAKRK